MTKYKFNVQWLLFIILIMATIIVNGQSEKICLLDKSNAMPISGATFQYADQNGLSDESGNIEFDLVEGTSMKLSHVSYGEWQLSEAMLKSAIQEGLYFRESLTVNLYPVTVIALRSKFDETETLDLDFQDKMAHDVGALLTQTPAISSIRKSGNYGFDPVLRGFKYDQLNIVLNGAQSAIAACPNRMDPPTSQMSPNMLERIEVLKGPHALRYGSAFGGTINFIPSPLRFSEKLKTYGRLSGGYDSNGEIMRSEGLLGFSSKHYDLSLFGSWSQGKDYKSGDGTTVQADFLRSSFGATLGLKLTEHQQLRLSATANTARDVDFPSLPMDLIEDNTWLFNARHDITFKSGNLKSWNTTLYGSFVDHLMNNLLKSLDPRMLNAETYATTYNYGGRTEGIWGFDNSNLYAGLDYRSDGAEGNRVREFLMGPNAGKTFTDNVWQEGQINKTGLFAEYHLQKKSFKWIISGRLELNTSNISDAAAEYILVYPDTKSTQLNSGISIGGVKTLAYNISIGLWLGRAQRCGNLTERFINYFPVGMDPYELLGNPQLNPEVNNQTDLTFEWKVEKSSVKVDVFAAYLQDMISSVIDTNLKPRLPSSPGVRQYTNLDKAFKTGFEASWSQLLFAGLQHQFSIAYTYAQNLELDEPLPEIAPLDMRYSLIGNYLNNKLRPEVTYRLVLEQSRVSPEYGETTTPGFNLLDVKVAYKINQMFNVTAGIQNLLDENYYEHLSRFVKGTDIPIYAPGRNIFISLNLNFM